VYYKAPSSEANKHTKSRIYPVQLSRPNRPRLIRPTLFLLASGLAGAGGARFVVGRPEPAATTATPRAAAVPPLAPVAPPALETVTGEAAYYARKFEGRRTASGAPFRNAEMVAAHRRYPFGTVLRVTNTSNQRSVEVTVVDRGPFGRHARILDLSRAAAERLDYIDEGLADVKVEVLSWGGGSQD
jgi:rare lipoprotein A